MEPLTLTIQPGEPEQLVSLLVHTGGRLLRLEDRDPPTLNLTTTNSGTVRHTVQHPGYDTQSKSELLFLMRGKLTGPLIVLRHDELPSMLIVGLTDRGFEDFVDQKHYRRHDYDPDSNFNTTFTEHPIRNFHFNLLGVSVTVSFDTDIETTWVVIDRRTNPEAIVPANLIIISRDDFEALRHDRMWSDLLPVEVHLIEGVELFLSEFS
jgi:hypothetical protein